MDSGSSGSGSASSSSSRSSAARTERLSVLGATLRLPRELCESANAFSEIASQATWARLADSDRRRLRRFLPDFPEDDAQEKDITLRRLFAGETFRFGSPLVDFARKLGAGVYRPRAQRLRRAAARAARRLAKRRRRRLWRNALPEVIARREKLLAQAGAPHSSPVPPERPPKRELLLRTRRRYFKELASIREEARGAGAILSDTADSVDAPPSPRRLPARSPGETAVASTIGRSFRPPPDDDWWRRALAVHAKRRRKYPSADGERLRFGSAPQTTNVAAAPSRTFAVDRSRTSVKLDRKRPSRIPRRQTFPPSSESEDEFKPNISMTGRTTLSMNANVSKRSDSEPPNPASISDAIVKQEEKSDEEIGLQLVQATHACFLSVIRDLVCSTPRHCLPLHSLESLLRNWRQNPIAPLNRWYSGVEDWVKVLPSAVAFLTGEGSGLPDDFVPYLQYKSASQVYQWIGAGRDSDSLLMPLCVQWLAQRQSSAVPPPPPPAATKNSSPTFTLETIEGLGSQLNPKWNSRWQVSAEELEAFRTQEIARFQRPHRAFTYCLPRAKIVVGPLKGVYGCDEPGTGANRVARGHTLLTSTRPRHVTLLALVRDAVACLPGGEGTRAHIAALVRRSQYIVADAPEQPLQAAVSGALDRMHGAPDPCVHYLPARKLWVYLHGDRTEEEFERLHAEMQVQSKNKAMANVQQKKSVSSKSKSSRPSKCAKNVTPAEVGSSSNVHIEDDVDVEDMNIDVEGPEPPIASGSLQVTSSIVKSPEKVNKTMPVLSGTSLLQPRGPVFTSTVLRRGGGTMQVGNSRSVVRVLSSTNTPGKSLISPNALQQISSQTTSQSTTIPTTKLVVQRSGVQTSGNLTPFQQKRLLESLMKHQKQQNQTLSHDQILQAINSKQKVSPPATISASTQNKSSTSPQTLQLAGQTVQLPSGQTVQLTGQAVQLTGQAVQLAGQTMQLGGQTVQIGNQTVQLTGQSIQLIGQTRPGVDSTSRTPAQRQNAPLVAKLLTNAQLRNTGNSGNAGQTGLRVSGLSLAQLQGKPLLLQTNSSQNKSSNIFLQTSGSGNTMSVAGNNTDHRPAAPKPATPTTQHTLLLGNIGGQVVRVAGSGALLGSTLRLQAPTTGAQNNSGMLLGSHTLKLQTAPLRLHQNVAGNPTQNRVLLTSGTRLHSLKILPVHHSLARGSNVGGRQVYARIVSPGNGSGNGNSNVSTQNVVVSTKSNTVTPTTTSQTPSLPSNSSSQPR